MGVRRIRLLNWNVNGLRAVLQRTSKTLQQFLDEMEADIMCFQETKLTRSELDADLARPKGYDAFYSFSRGRSGYSGVVTFVKSDLPTVAAEEGLTGRWPTEDAIGHVGAKLNDIPAKFLTELDSEGRCVITDHQAFVLINVYCPALASQDRLDFKLAFHELLQDRVRALQQANRQVIVVGDINISHRAIDHCDPQSHGDEETFATHPCRQWMDGFVQDLRASSECKPESVPGRLVDAFRYFHPDRQKSFTCWNTVTGARQTNYGTRIDYVLVDPGLVDESIVSCDIEPDRLGSDHCPVVMNAVVQLDQEKDAKTAALCSKYFNEFAGKQQGIHSYLVQHGHDHCQDSITSKEDSRWLLQEALFSQPQAQSQATQLSRRPTKYNSGTRPKPNGGQRSIASFFQQKASTTKPTSLEKASNPINSSLSPASQEIPFEFDEFRSGKRKSTAHEWRQVLSGQAPQTPLCYCQIPTVSRTVLKTNDNWGRKFYVCTKPAGEKGHPDARCDFFQWADKRDRTKRIKSDADATTKLETSS